MVLNKSVAQNSKERPLKFSSYLSPCTAKALRRFAVEREYPVYRVLEAALRKCIPDEYFR